MLGRQVVRASSEVVLHQDAVASDDIALSVLLCEHHLTAEVRRLDQMFSSPRTMSLSNFTLKVLSNTGFGKMLHWVSAEMPDKPLEASPSQVPSL